MDLLEEFEYKDLLNNVLILFNIASHPIYDQFSPGLVEALNALKFRLKENFTSFESEDGVDLDELGNFYPELKGFY